jgi:putative transposase
VPLGSDDDLLKGLLNAALERGLEVELSDHVWLRVRRSGRLTVPNLRKCPTAKTVCNKVGDVELAISRDRNCSFTPQLLPKRSRRSAHQRRATRGLNPLTHWVTTLNCE